MYGEKLRNAIASRDEGKADNERLAEPAQVLERGSDAREPDLLKRHGCPQVGNRWATTEPNIDEQGSSSHW